MKSKSKGVIGGTVIGLVLAGVGAFGAIKGLGLRVVHGDQVEDVAVKYNYKIVDFTNDSKSIEASEDNLKQLFKTSKEGNLITDVLLFDNCFLDGGGVRIGTRSKQGNFRIEYETGFDNYRIKLQAYNAPQYVDASKGVDTIQYDKKGEAIVQTWNCDHSFASYAFYPSGQIDGSVILLSHNNGELKAPKVDSIIYTPSNTEAREDNNFDIYNGEDCEDQTSGVYGRIILLSFEAWNDTDKTAKDTTPTEDATTSTEASA